ncbi:MAG: hypothetical protein LBB08_00610 [Rickettsiales bacterium]|jgi:hypothetical protein|nr:hypothetical protein [Rickettsiales bacterium]
MMKIQLFILALMPSLCEAATLHVKTYDSGSRLLHEKKAYDSIDGGNVPLWDEYIPSANKTDYQDVRLRGELSPGEWEYWKTEDSRGDFKKMQRDAFWHSDVDQDAFERLSDRESLDNRGMILYDTRSCPSRDSVACKEYLSTPHAVESLPEGRGFVPDARMKTPDEIEAEALLKSKEKKPSPESREKPEEDPWADNMEFQGCPFETEDECVIWKSKPAAIETMSNKNPLLSVTRVESIIAVSNAGNEITSDMADAAPLVGRYKTLLNASRACCESGLQYSLEQAGAGKGLVYKFMVDDANFYQFTERCLMITDEELDERYANTKTAEIVADVRDGCLCRQRQFFETLLAPFAQMAAASRKFADSPLKWKYTDGLGREIMVSLNHDADAVLRRLANCP